MLSTQFDNDAIVSPEFFLFFNRKPTDDNFMIYKSSSHKCVK